MKNYMPNKKISGHAYRQAGFTLVELLIVIALIAILSVAVLATINPIEQTNKARDARVQNDAAEVLGAYERYYAAQNKYPWESFSDGADAYYGPNDFVLLRSDTIGFGICSGADNPASLLLTNPDSAATECSSSDATPNLLISSSELKDSFAGKDEFDPVLDGHLNQAMWTAKAADANSIYVCYIPRANANRIDPDKMRCLNSTDGTVAKAGGSCSTTVTDYDVPVLDGSEAMFRCVPE